MPVSRVFYWWAPNHPLFKMGAFWIGFPDVLLFPPTPYGYQGHNSIVVQKFYNETKFCRLLSGLSWVRSLLKMDSDSTCYGGSLLRGPERFQSSWLIVRSSAIVLCLSFSSVKRGQVYLFSLTCSLLYLFCVILWDFYSEEWIVVLKTPLTFQKLPIKLLINVWQGYL